MKHGGKVTMTAEQLARLGAGDIVEVSGHPKQRVVGIDRQQGALYCRKLTLEERFVLWLAGAAATVVHWARVAWCYGECVQCNRRVCPKVGPWYARRRERCYCNRCEWQP